MMIGLEDIPGRAAAAVVEVGSILAVTVSEATIPELSILVDTRTPDVVRATLLGRVPAGSGRAIVVLIVPPARCGRCTSS